MAELNEAKVSSPPYDPNGKSMNDVNIDSDHEEDLKYDAESKRLLSAKKPFYKQKRLLIPFGIVIGLAIIAGTLGGLLHRSKAPKAASPYADADFTALTAAECEKATFVVYQKNHDASLYLRGQMKSGTYNGTSSPLIPEMHLQMAKDVVPAPGTNITSLCRPSDNSASLDLYLYYTAPRSASTYQIIEGILRFGDLSQASLRVIEATFTPVGDVPITMKVIPSITATSVPSNDVLLYYLGPSSDDLSGNALIYQMIRSDETGWTTPSALLSTNAHDSHAGLSVSATSDTNIHLVYGNIDNVLSTKSWNGLKWSAESILTLANSPSESLSNVPTISSVNLPQSDLLHLYYISIIHAYSVTINITSSTYIGNGVVHAASYDSFPIVEMSRPLIAATSSNSVSSQVFFVRGRRDVPGKLGTAILNATEVMGSGSWGVSTLG